MQKFASDGSQYLQRWTYSILGSSIWRKRSWLIMEWINRENHGTRSVLRFQHPHDSTLVPSRPSRSPSPHIGRYPREWVEAVARGMLHLTSVNLQQGGGSSGSSTDRRGASGLRVNVGVECENGFTAKYRLPATPCVCQVWSHKTALLFVLCSFSWSKAPRCTFDVSLQTTKVFCCFFLYPYLVRPDTLWRFEDMCVKIRSLTVILLCIHDGFNNFYFAKLLHEICQRWRIQSKINERCHSVMSLVANK